MELFFECCGSRLNIPGCFENPAHDFENFDALALNWQFESSPAHNPYLQVQKRQAVVIDCEMGGSEYGRSELIQLSAVDFFSGDVLVDNLVKPAVPVRDYRSQYSGITEAHMHRAVNAGTALEGWRAARAELAQFIDAETILIGHSLNNDLEQLRLIHTNVIDTHMLIPRLAGHKHGLAALAAALCGRQVQSGARLGHDCREDTLAARELVLWALRNPGLYVERARRSDAEDQQRQADAEENRRRRAAEKLEREAEKLKREAVKLEREAEAGNT